MAIATVPCYDAIRTNRAHLPPGQHAGYTTGSGVVPWLAADWAADPHAVRIDQSPDAHDPIADVLDVETGAATVADVPRWAEAAAASFAQGKRHGQRTPAVYVNLSNLTAAANALAHAGIKSGVSLWLANWNLTEPAARALVVNAAGPYPVIGVQYGNRGAYDISVFSVPWLGNVSGGGTPPKPAGWAYPAPGGLSAGVTRAVTLSWPAAKAPAGHPAPGSYTVEILRAGKQVRQQAVAGLTVTVTGLAPGAYEVRVWANGGITAPAHATASFTV